MEVYIDIKYDNLNPSDLSRESDTLFRGIQKAFPQAVWERKGLGFKVTTFE
jgi:hypothetical protein